MQDMNHYEQTALVFYSEKNFFMSYNLFLDALAIEKDNSMLWYGLGDSLCAYSVQKKVEKFYRIGIACIKKSLDLNPENEYSTKMIARLKVDPSISEDYISKISTLTFEQAIRLRIKIPTKKLIDNFQRLRSPDDQIKVIKQLGDSENAQFAPLLAHCIIHSENENVRFAALERM